MKKEYDVFWSYESRKQVDLVIDYLETNFSEKEIRKFLLSLSGFEKMVVLFPEIFPLSLEIPGARKAVLSKLISIIYTIEEKRIYIYSVWDNRRDPDDLKKIQIS